MAGTTRLCGQREGSGLQQDDTEELTVRPWQELCHDQQLPTHNLKVTLQMDNHFHRIILHLRSSGKSPLWWSIWLQGWPPWEGGWSTCLNLQVQPCQEATGLQEQEGAAKRVDSMKRRAEERYSLQVTPLKTQAQDLRPSQCHPQQDYLTHIVILHPKMYTTDYKWIRLECNGLRG